MLSGQVPVILVKHAACESYVCNSQWLNSRTLIAIDVTERAHVLDVRSEEELEVIEVTQAELVYQNSFYKSLATGGNVSEALVRNSFVTILCSF